MRQNIRFSIIGRRDGLKPGVLKEVQKTIDCSRDNQGMRLCLALNYGSRGEERYREMIREQIRHSRENR